MIASNRQTSVTKATPAFIRKKASQHGEPFFKGKEKRKRLEELADEAHAAHEQSQHAWRGALEHARTAGIALNEAFRITGRRKGWSAWRDDWCKRFKVKPPTVRDYRRIAKHWNDPIIELARESGVEVDSIKAVLDLLNGKKKDDPEEEPSEVEMMRAELRKEFAQRLRKMTRRELEAFYQDHFHEGTVWNAMALAIETLMADPERVVRIERHEKEQQDQIAAAVERSTNRTRKKKRKARERSRRAA